MSDHSEKPVHKRKGSENRASPRYRMPSPPEVQLLGPESSTPINARLGDLSSGGCFVETDYLPPQGTEVTITFKKSGDHLKAQAQVVRVSPNEGLALVFTSMEAEDFRTLESWLSIFVATAWVAANRRGTQRVAMEIEVRVSGYNTEGARFTEDTHTVQISGFGCLVTLRTPVNRGKRLILTNLQTKKTVECLVAYHEASGDAWQVGLAFIALNQSFWPVDFPPADWSRQHPDAKKAG
jgi:PilZ domain-containing protein